MSPIPTGTPVTGLTQNDFRVFEDDKPQKIASFKEHTGAPITTADLPPMPPNVYTNYPGVKTADSINVLLMDSLNTQMPDQQYVHQQTLKYLKTLPAGARVAIFTLSSRLRMVQEFTSDSSRLLAALNDPALSGPRHSPLLKSQAESQADNRLDQSSHSESNESGRDSTHSRAGCRRPGKCPQIIDS